MYEDFIALKKTHVVDHKLTEIPKKIISNLDKFITLLLLSINNNNLKL